MNQREKISVGKFYLALFFLVALLQAVDFLVLKIFPPLINDKMVFGSYGGNSVGILLSFILIFVLLSLQAKNKSLMLINAFVIAGALSNILDRFFYGGAVDYISISRFPVFNLADVFIVLGCIILAFNLIQYSNKKPLE